MDSIDPVMSQGPTKFFAAYKQISLIGSVPTKFTINSTTNWGLCLQAALACLPTLSGPVMSNDGRLDACGGLRIACGLRMSMKSMKQRSEEEEGEW